LDSKNAEIKAKNTELSNSNILKEKLIGLVSHDTRSPLAYTSGALEIINQGDTDAEETKSLLKSLEQKTKEALEDTDGIIKWARAQLSGIEVKLEPIDAHEIFDEITTGISTEFQQKKIKFKQDYTKQCLVYADKTLLKLTLKNLLVNAAKFSYEYDLITLRYEKSDGFCLIKVIDNGIGMDKEEVEKLFTLQSQSKKGTNNERGTGLGLLQCYEFVNKMNGTLSVESKKHMGTVFTIKLPDQPIKK
jgi:signal transduction histidine kinase